jgi:HEAT repeat protein
MVTDELAPLEEQLRSEELIDREVAATRLAQAGHEGVRLLAAIAMDPHADPGSRLTALRHLPANEEAVPVLRRLLDDPLPTLRHAALDKAEQARAWTLIPLIRKLTADPESYWDLDEEIAIGAVARRVLHSLTSE